MRLNIISITILTLFLVACKSNNTPSSAVKDNPQALEIKIDPAQAKEANLDEIAKNFTIINLDESDDAIIGNVSKLEFYNDRFYILCRVLRTVFCFDINGHLIYKINNHGKGPTEYIDLEYFYLDRENKEMVLSERTRTRLLRYNLDNGKFIGDIQLDFYIDQIIKNGNNVILNSDSPSHGKLMIYNSSLSKLKNMYFPYERGIGDMIPPNVFSCFNNEVLYTHAFEDIIYRVDSDYIEPYITIDFGKAKVGKDFFKGDLTKILDKQREFMKKKYASAIHELHENETHISFLYPQGNSMYQVFIAKSTKEVSNYKKIYFSKDNVSISFPISIYKDKFVSIVYPGEIEGLDKEKISPETNLPRLFESMENSDNASLLMYNIK